VCQSHSHGDSRRARPEGGTGETQCTLAGVIGTGIPIFVRAALAVPALGQRATGAAYEASALRRLSRALVAIDAPRFRVHTIAIGPSREAEGRRGDEDRGDEEDPAADEEAGQPLLQVLQQLALHALR
jgi:hypothetical protein